MDFKKHLPDWDFVDTWAEMQKLPAAGKVKNIGVSNFGIGHLERLLDSLSCKITPAVNQIELHTNNPSPKLVAYNTSTGIHSTGYSCLGSTESPLCKNATLRELASRKGKTVQQVLIVWGITKGWSVIPESVTEERTKKNFDIDVLQLTEEEMGVIDKMPQRFTVCDGSFLPPEMHGKVFCGDDEYTGCVNISTSYWLAFYLARPVLFFLYHKRQLSAQTICQIFSLECLLDSSLMPCLGVRLQPTIAIEPYA